MPHGAQRNKSNNKNNKNNLQPLAKVAAYSKDRQVSESLLHKLGKYKILSAGGRDRGGEGG